MPRRVKVVKVSRRDANHESLEKKYGDAGRNHLQRWGVSSLLNLYKSGYIHTKRTIERQIKDFLQPSKNPTKKQQQLLETIGRYFSKTPNAETQRGKKLAAKAKEVEEALHNHNIMDRTEHINDEKPFTTINIHLNAKPAYPNMPDIDHGEPTILDENFEKGEPSKDVDFHHLSQRLKRILINHVREQMVAKDSIKIQVGAYFQI